MGMKLKKVKNNIRIFNIDLGELKKKYIDF